MIETCPEHGGQIFKKDQLRFGWLCPIPQCSTFISKEWLYRWGWLW